MRKKQSMLDINYLEKKEKDFALEPSYKKNNLFINTDLEMDEDDLWTSTP